MSRFTSDFQSGLIDLMRWRRDVRRFRTDPVDEALLTQCLDTFLCSPSVGLSEPWRLVRIDSDKARAAALDNFRETNAQALDGYSGDKAKLYSTLKLTGMQDAPVQLAVFCDTATAKGAGLGALTMPEMRQYSVVAAITQFWLYARSQGLGGGGGSSRAPARRRRDLDLPDDWSLIAYLCVGWPEACSDTPELEQAGWEDRRGSLPLEVR
ncbi:MAG: 5,6-dimethylbenzimidazole synthase [Roseovarius sp.]